MDEGNFEFMNDVRLSNAVNAYMFVLQNTIHSFDGLDCKLEVIANEAIKSAKDIAFKYLGMEADIARADVANKSMNEIIKKLMEEEE